MATSTVTWGSQGLKVSRLGFGCMGLTGIYNSPVSDKVGISIIKHAFASGITFFDSSDMYSPRTNETLLGKALKHLPSKPDYVRACCEARLRRLE